MMQDIEELVNFYKTAPPLKKGGSAVKMLYKMSIYSDYLGIPIPQKKFVIPGTTICYARSSDYLQRF